MAASTRLERCRCRLTRCCSRAKASCRTFCIRSLGGTQPDAHPLRWQRILITKNSRFSLQAKCQMKPHNGLNVNQLLLLCLASFLVGCAPNREVTASGNSEEVVVAGTEIDGADLEGSEPIATLSPAEFLDYIEAEARLPKFDDDTACDDALYELKGRSLDVTSVTKNKVEVRSPVEGLSYQFRFNKPCSEQYRTR